MKPIIKTLIIALATFLACAETKSQENFRWDITINSSKSKEQLYADTQDFIRMTWRTRGKQIVQENEADGFILAKGNLQSYSQGEKNDYKVYNIEYTIRFFLSDGTYRLVIDSLQCTSAHTNALYGTRESIRIPISEQYPFRNGKGRTGIGRKEYNRLMSVLKRQVQDVADEYMEYMTDTPPATPD